MKIKNDFVGHKSFGLFVVITIGVIFFAYIAFGIVSLELRAERIKNKNHQANKTYSIIRQSDEQQTMKNGIDMIAGTVLTIENNIVTIEADLGDGALSEVRLLVGGNDLSLIQTGDEITAKLFSGVAVSEMEDGVLEVSNVIVKEQ
ncbi:MAG: hypothetical protein U9M90_00785 [Patescibacteria group bacterium]|nr:hypothetical protein [Patescibacteria group bacterium]